MDVELFSSMIELFCSKACLSYMILLFLFGITSIYLHTYVFGFCSVRGQKLSYLLEPPSILDDGSHRSLDPPEDFNCDLATECHDCHSDVHPGGLRNSGQSL